MACCLKALPGRDSRSQLSAFFRRCQDKTRIHAPDLGMQIDNEQCRISIDGKDLNLTVTEFKILKELTQKLDQVTNRTVIQKKVLGRSGRTRSLDVHICSLRKIVQWHGLDIQSVRGVGYRLVKMGAKDAAFNAAPQVC